MRNKLQRIFNPTPEEQEEDMRRLAQIVKELVSEKCCVTCEAYIPDDPYLPGFVIPAPECKYGGSAIETCERYKTSEEHKKLLEKYLWE